MVFRGLLVAEVFCSGSSSALGSSGCRGLLLGRLLRRALSSGLGLRSWSFESFGRLRLANAQIKQWLLLNFFRFSRVRSCLLHRLLSWLAPKRPHDFFL